MSARLRADQLRQIAIQLRLPALRDVVRSPMVSEALRLTVAYAEAPRRPPDQVATLMMGHTDVWQEVHYLLPDLPPAPREPFPMRRYRELKRALFQAGLDRLDDQPVKSQGRDLWLLERASAHYHRDLVLVPGEASDVHLKLVEAVRQYWPEALQELQR
ncbi:MAG: hypothetical protein Kow00120_28850 [Anaerolineae bacterium]